jgi:sugar lactone lactonase YvrE
MSRPQGGYIGNTPITWEPGNYTGVWRPDELQSLMNKGEWARTNWSLKTAKYVPPYKKFDLFGIEPEPSCAIFNGDGTKMYVVGISKATIFEFNLSTAWDVTTAVYREVNLFVGGYDRQPQELSFNSDGTKLFMIGMENSSLVEINLSTAYDLRTSSFGKQLKLTNSEPYPAGLTFKPDGLILYVVGTANDTISQFALDYAYDITSVGIGTFKKRSVGLTTNIVLDNISRLPERSQGSLEVTPKSLSFNSDGSVAFILGDDGQIYTWYLGSNYQVDQASFNRFRTTKPVSLDFELKSPQSLFVRPNGYNFYVVDSSTACVAQYTLPSPFALDQLKIRNERNLNIGNSPMDLSISPDGRTMFVLCLSDDTVKMYRTNTPWNFQKLMTESRDLTFSSFGHKFYVSDNANIFQYDLTTNWDIRTATYNDRKLNTSGFSEVNEGNIRGVKFKPDGTKMFVLGYDYDRIFEFNLTTPWDVTTAVYTNNSLYIGNETGSPYNLDFSTDGTKVYFSDDNRYVWCKFLTTPWSLQDSTNGGGSTIDLRNIRYGPDRYYIEKVRFSDDGQRLYVAYRDGNVSYTEIHQYRMNWPWMFDTQYNNPQGLAFSPNGLIMYTAEYDAHRIHQYSLSEAYNIRTAGFATSLILSEKGGWHYNTWPAYPVGVGIASTGNRLFVISRYNNCLMQYNLGTAFNVTSVGLGTTAYYWYWDDTTMEDLCFSSDGRKLFMYGNANDKVYEYPLNDPFNIDPSTSLRQGITTTIVGLGTSSSLSTVDNDIRGIAISTDGNYFYATGLQNRSVYRWNLGIGNSIKGINGVAANETLRIWNNYFGDKEYYPYGLAFSTDGKRMYTSGNYWDGRIHQFNLNNSWSISTSGGINNVSFAGTFNTYSPMLEEHFDVNTPTYGNQDTRIRGIGIGSTGDAIYLLGYNKQEIVKYPLSTSYYVRSSIGATAEFYQRYNYTGVGLVSSFNYQVGFATGGYWYGGSPQVWRGGEGRFSEGNAQSIYVRPDGKTFYILGVDSRMVYQYFINTATPWNINQDLYHKTYGVGPSYQDYGIDVTSSDSKVGIGTSFAYLREMDTEPRGITFKPDGLRMYMVGSNSRSVWQMELFEAWKVGTANTGLSGIKWLPNAGGNGFTSVGAAKSFYLGNEEFYPYDVDFNTDGSKMYVVGVNSDRVFQYDLERPWEIDSAKYNNQNIGISTVEGNAYGMFWRPDGSQLYITGANGYVYDFESPITWNTDYANTYLVQPGYGVTTVVNYAGINTITDISFNDGLSKAYVVGGSVSFTSQAIEYTLGTSFNIGTSGASIPFGDVAVGRSNYFFRLDQANGYIRASAFSTDGKYYFSAGYNNDRVWRVELTTPWDISNTNVGIATTTTIGILGISSVYIGSQEPNCYGMNFNHDGTKMYIVGANHYVYQYNIPSQRKWDISSATYSTNFYVDNNSEGTTPTSVGFSSDGRRMYVTSHTNSHIREYYLDEPWDLNYTVSRAENLLLAGNAATPTDVTWKTDGTRVYVSGQSRGEIFQYDVSTPWDVTTGIGTTGISIAAQELQVTGLAFNNTGTKMYVVGLASTAVLQYGLTTAWNVRSAAFEKRFSVYPEERYPEEVGFNSDGTKMYILGRQLNNIIEYNLGTAYDVATADAGNVGFASTGSYAAVTVANISVGVAVTNNGTNLFSLVCTAGNGNWTQSAIGNSAFAAPVTIEFRKSANSSSALYAAVGFATTSGSTLSYTSGDALFYPYQQSDGLAVYEKGTNTFTNRQKDYDNNTVFRIGYGTDGWVRYFMGKVQVSAKYVGNGKSLYPAFYFYSTGAQIDDVRISTSGFSTFSDATPTMPMGNSLDVEQKAGGTNRGFFMSADGKNLVTLDDGNDRLYRYSLGKSYSVGSGRSVGIDTNTSDRSAGYGYIGGLDSAAYGVGFNTDGTRVYLVGANNRLYQWNSELTYQPRSWRVPSFYLGFQDTSPWEVRFSEDGRLMWMLGNSGNKIFTYTLERPWDIESAHHNSEDIMYLQNHPNYANSFNVKFKTEDIVYSVGYDNRVNQMPAPKSWLGRIDNKAEDVTFANDGRKMYVVGSDRGSITQYEVMTPYDMASARPEKENKVYYTHQEPLKRNVKLRNSYDNQMPMAETQETEASGFAFNNDGSKMYILGKNTDTVFQYNLGIPYNTQKNVSIAGTFYVGFQEIEPESIKFKPDGTKMYVVGTSSDRVLQYDLDQPWEIVSASWNGKKASITSPALNYYAYSLITQDINPREFVFNNDGTKGYMLGTERSTVHTYNLNTAWDITTLSVSTGASFSFVNYERSPEGLFFKPDGSEMYVVGIATTSTIFSGLGSARVAAGIATTMGNLPGNIFQFTLSSPWNVTTASFTTSFYVGNQENQPKQVVFKPDGTKMYLTGIQRDRLQEYKLETPWNVSSAKYEDYSLNNFTFFADANDSRPESVAFSTDGSKMYTLGWDNGRVTQYELPTAFNVRSLETTPRAFAFGSEGTKFYVVGTDHRRVYQFSLSTPYDVTTAAYTDKYFNVYASDSENSYEATPTGIGFNSTGSKMYIMGHSRGLSQFDLRTPWDVSTTKNEENPYGSVGVASTAFYPGSSQAYYPYGLGFSTDGYKAWWADGSNVTNTIQEIEFTRPFGISSSYYSSRFDNYERFPQAGRSAKELGQGDSRLRFYMKSQYSYAPTAVGWGSDGRILYVLDANMAMIQQYHCPAPYDLFNFTEKPRDIGFSTDGRKMYVLGDDQQRIYQVEVGLGSVGYDIVHSRFDYKWLQIDTNLENQPKSFQFKPDGTQLYMYGQNRDRVYRYDLTTPWDISTAGLGTTSIYIGDRVAGGYGLRFKPDGTRMYIADYDNYKIWQYNLPNAWDFSNAAFGTDRYLADYRTWDNAQVRPVNLGFSTYGDKMFFMDFNNDRVMSFNLNTTWDISSVGVGTTFFNVGNLETNPWVLGFSTDGTKMFVAGDDQYNLVQYDMGNQSTAPGISSSWNVGIATTALWHGAKWQTNSPGMTGVGRSFNFGGPSIAGTYFIGPWETSPSGFYFDPNGTRMWICGQQNNYVREFRFDASPWDLRWSNNNNCLAVGGTVFQQTQAGYQIDSGAITDLKWKDDGTRLWILSDNTNRIHQWNVTSPWRLETAYIPSDFRTSAGSAVSSRTLSNGQPQSFLWNNDGTRLFVTEYNNGTTYIYETPKAWDVTELTDAFRVNTFYHGNEEYYSYGSAFSSDGKRYYTVGQNSRWYVNQYELDNPYSFNRRGIQQYANAMAFSTDGARLWQAGEFRDTIYQNDIRQPWKVGVPYEMGNGYSYTGGEASSQVGIATTFTAINRSITRPSDGLTTSAYIRMNIESPLSVAVRPTGQRYFVLENYGSGRPDVHQYNATDAWDVGNISIGGSFKMVQMWTTAGIITETDPTGLSFSYNGDIMYIAGRDYDRIYQHYLGTPWNINTIYGDEFLGIGTTSAYIGDREATISNVAFSTDGRRMYFSGTTNNTVFQYDCFVPFDVRSGVYRGKSFYYGLHHSGAGDIRFNDIGTLMYMSDTNDNEIHQYRLQTPWEVWTAYPDGGNDEWFYYGDDENGWGFDISQDGKHAVISGNSRYRVWQYDLRSPWETMAGDRDPHSMTWRTNGSMFFVAGRSRDRLERWSVSDSNRYWDLRYAGFDTGNYVSIAGPKSNGQRTRYNTATARSIEITPDGTKMLHANGGSVRQLSLGSTHKAHTASYYGVNLSLNGPFFDTSIGVTGITTNVGYGTTGSAEGGGPGRAKFFRLWNDTDVRSVAFSTDGAKMFVLAGNTDKVYTFGLQEAWNVGSASTVGIARSFYVGQEDGEPYSLRFNFNGSRMYIAGNTNDRIHQYNLSTNYVVGGASTVSYAGSCYLNYNNFGDSTPLGIEFNTSGTKMWMVGQDSDYVYEYNLSTPWDITTVGLGTTSYYFGYQEQDARSIRWSSDGRKMFIFGRSSHYSGGAAIHEYDCSVAFAVTTAVHNGNRSQSLDNFGGTAMDFVWHPQGDRLFMLDNSYDQVVQIDVPVQWSMKSYENDLRYVGFASGGTKLYTVGNQRRIVDEFNLSTAYDVGVATHSGNKYVLGAYYDNHTFYHGYQEGEVRGIGFGSDGRKLYVGGGNQVIYQYELGQAWNLHSRVAGTGGTSTKTFNTTPGSYLSGINFHPNGTKVYFSKYQNQLIEEHTLTTPWDITTANLTMGTTVGLGTTAPIGISTYENTPTAVAFSTDGTKMYVTGHQQSRVYQYDLSTPWSIATAGLGTTSFYIGYQEASPWSLGFSTDGRKMYVHGTNKYRLFQYDLSIAWNVGSATTATGYSEYLYNRDNGMIGVAMSDRGTSFYAFGNNQDRIYRYEMPDAWELRAVHSEPRSIGFSTAGDRMFIAGFTAVGEIGINAGVSTLGIDSTGITEHVLTTPWNVSSTRPFAKADRTILNRITSGTPEEIRFNKTGDKLFALGRERSYIYPIGLTTAWNISEIYSLGHITDSRTNLYTGNEEGTPYSFCFTENERHLGLTGSNNYLHTYDLSAPYNVENLEDSVGGIYMKDDGTAFWTVGDSYGTVYEYTITTPFDLKTAKYTGKNFYVGREVSSISGIEFDPTGRRMFVSGSGFGSGYKIVEFDLKVAWDITTAHVQTGRIGGKDVSWTGGYPYDFRFKPDGTKMYISGLTSITEYTNPESWRVSGPIEKSDYRYGYGNEIPTGGGIVKNVTVGAGGSMMYVVGWSSCAQYRIAPNSSGISMNPNTIQYIDNEPTSVFIGNNGTKMYVLGRQRYQVYQFTLTTAYDVGTAIFDNKVFYHGHLENNAYEVRFNTDGTKMYVLGYGNDRIYQITLATPWDLQGAYYSGRYFQIKVTGDPGQEGTATGFDFSVDGRKMFLVGQDRDCIFEYDLTTPWEITSAGINTTTKYVLTAGVYQVGVGKSFSFQSREGSPTSVAFSTDGRYAYVVGTDYDRIRGWYMSTPWDVSTISLGSTLNQQKYIGELETNPRGIHFGIGGTTIYVVGTSSVRVHQYSIPSANKWDVGFSTIANKYTARFDTQLQFNGGLRLDTQETTSASAIGWNTTGTRFYMMGYQNDKVYQYTVTRPWDLQSTSGIGSTSLTAGVINTLTLGQYYIPGPINKGTFTGIGQQTGIGFKTDGTRMFTVGISSISQYDLYSPWTITNIGEINATGLAFKSDGSKIYVLGTEERRVYTLNLSTNWDLATASIASTTGNSFFIGTQFSETSPQDLFFKPDGTKMFVVATGSDMVFEYNLTTAWDVTTAGIAATTSTRSLTVDEYDPRSIGFSTDGKNMYILGAQNDALYQVKLFKEWSIEDPQEFRPTSVYFKPDGTRMFWSGKRTATVFSVDLEIPFDVTSVSANGKTYYVGAQEAQPNGVGFSTDGRRMFVVGTRRNTIFSYELGVQWDVSTARYLGLNLDLSMRDPAISGLTFTSDGSKLIAVGSRYGKMLPYTMT